jgi:hypothetical protein
VVSTTYAAPNAIDVTVAGCLATDVAYDLSQGMGWFLTGTMELPGGNVAPVTPVAQTATVKLPKKIKPKGKTVLLKKPVVTNAGQQATAKLSWSTKKSAKGKKAKYAKVITKEVDLQAAASRTTGKAKKLYVKLHAEGPGGRRLHGLLVHQEVDGEEVGPGSSATQPAVQRRGAAGCP